MTEILPNDIEKMLSTLAIEELLELEEKIIKIIKQKIRKSTSEDWIKDFLSVSVWTHLLEFSTQWYKYWNLH